MAQSENQIKENDSDEIRKFIEKKKSQNLALKKMMDQLQSNTIHKNKKDK